MTYDYVCVECGHTWEQEQSIKSNPEKVCPKCGKETAKRLISANGSFILVGGGWAAGGYSSK